MNNSSHKPPYSLPLAFVVQVQNLVDPTSFLKLAKHLQHHIASLGTKEFRSLLHRSCTTMVNLIVGLLTNIREDSALC
jgi:hypothetical protein